MKKSTLLVLAILATTPFLLYAKMEVVPLVKTEEGHLEIQASINGVNAKFILDTGATGSLIDSNKLSVFGITINQEKIDGVRTGDEQTGRIDTFPVHIKQFSIGNTQLNIKSIYSNDSSGQFEKDVMGLIGYDALAESRALLDVKNLQLLIPEKQGDVQAWLSDTSNNAYTAIDLHKSAMGFSFVDAKLGDNQVRLLVDSGAPELILDESTLIQFGFALTPHPSAKTVVAEGIELPMKVLKKGIVTIADRVLEDDFFTTDFTALLNTINVKGQPRFIGILGNQHLLQMNTIIDVANGKLYIKN